MLPPLSSSSDSPDAAHREGLPGRIFAAPSWVIPGTLADNCLFLAGRADEVGLLFLETAACLAYRVEDLPSFLADLPLRYHAHLPLDLPWDDPEKTASICAALLDKIAFLAVSGHSRLSPPTDSVPAERGRGDCPLPSGKAKLHGRPGMALRQARISLENSDQKRISTTGRSREVAAPVRAVLHPPVSDPADTPGAARLLGKFADALALLGHTPSTLLLENVRGNDLSALRCVVLDYGFGVCFDTGHALAYGQKKLLRDAVLLERVALLHVSAPGRGEQTGRHLPLSSLDQAGKALCATLCREAPPEAAIMPELFRWKDILDSLPLIRAWLLPQE